MSETYENHKLYRFDGFTLDVDRGTLHRGDEEISLRPKSWQVLCVLVERAGTLVSRDELLDAVWAGSVVTDDAVTQCLIDIRKGLGDKSIIRTVPKRGYVLETTVETPSTEPPPKASDHKTLRNSVVAALLIILVATGAWYITGDKLPVDEQEQRIAARPSIAVMPFAVIGSEADSVFFADGVSEDILNKLATQDSLRVIARTSSFSFRDQQLDIAGIADKLDVTHILEGSVRRDSKSIRVTVQLVDAGSGEYLWSSDFDEELTAASLFAIQGQIAEYVVNALTARLSSQQREQLAGGATEDLVALELFFEARHLMESRAPEPLARAVELLEEATNRDPGFARAFVALADALRLYNNYGTLGWEESNERGSAAALRALSLDDQLGEAYASIGNLETRWGNIEAAEKAYLRAIELSPNYAPGYQWYGEFLAAMVSRTEEAVRYSRIAVALDPMSPIIHNDYAESLSSNRQADEALAQLDIALDIDPEFFVAHYTKGILLLEQGDFRNALDSYLEAEALLPDSQGPKGLLGQLFLDLGLVEQAEDYSRAAIALNPNSVHAHLLAMRLNAAIGRPDEALAAADAALKLSPWQPTALRFKRDRLLEADRLDDAMDLYRPIYGYLFAESKPSVSEINWRAAIDMALVLMELGREDIANEILSASMTEARKRPRTGWAPYWIADARIHAIGGNQEQALDALREAVESG